MERFNLGRQTNLGNSLEFGLINPADLGDAVRSYFNICQVVVLDDYPPVGFHGKVWGYLVDGKLEEMEHNLKPSRQPSSNDEGAYFACALFDHILGPFREGHWPYEPDFTDV